MGAPVAFSLSERRFVEGPSECGDWGSGVRRVRRTEVRRYARGRPSRAFDSVKAECRVKSAPFLDPRDRR